MSWYILKEWNKGFENHCLLRGELTSATHPSPQEKCASNIIYWDCGVKKTLKFSVTPIPRKRERQIYVPLKDVSYYESGNDPHGY